MEAQALTQLLTMLLAFSMIILFVLIVVFITLTIKKRKQENSPNKNTDLKL